MKDFKCFQCLQYILNLKSHLVDFKKAYFNTQGFPMYHVDNTYSVNKYRDLLLAFGRSDLSDHLFPIALAILKGEKALYPYKKKLLFYFTENELFLYVFIRAE